MQVLEPKGRQRAGKKWNKTAVRAESPEMQVPEPNGRQREGNSVVVCVWWLLCVIAVFE